MHISGITSNGEMKVLNLEHEVIYLQTNGQGRMHVYTHEGEYRTAEKVEDWMSLTGRRGFLRVARGIIVNLSKIIAFDRVRRVVHIERLQQIHSLPITDHAMRLLNRRLSDLNTNPHPQPPRSI